MTRSRLVPDNEHKVAQRCHWLTNEIAAIRDRLIPICDGEVERGRKLSTYDPKAGKRKATLKDAREICHHAVARIDQILNKFHEMEERDERFP
jgi:hypothetical protein